MSECNFRLGHYQDTLYAYRDAGYELIDFARYFSSQDLPDKFVVLRHDIDFALDYTTWSFANLEQPLGVCSTYFVRLHAPRYNTLSYFGLYVLKALAATGHSIGWHAEPDMVELAGIKYPEMWFTHSIGVLNSVLPSNICAISFHCVSKGKNDSAIMGLIKKSPYPLVTHDMSGLKYLSDSNGRWREGCFCQWIDKEPGLHVLTHPIWWFWESPQENY